MNEQQNKQFMEEVLAYVEAERGSGVKVSEETDIPDQVDFVSPKEMRKLNEKLTFILKGKETQIQYLQNEINKLNQARQRQDGWIPPQTSGAGTLSGIYGGVYTSTQPNFSATPIGLTNKIITAQTYIQQKKILPVWNPKSKYKK